MLELLADNPQSGEYLVQAFDDHRFRGVAQSDVVETLRRLSLVDEDADHRLKPSPLGRDLLVKPPSLRIRLQVQKLIDTENPQWLALATQGRRVLLRYVDANITQCLEEAGLTDDSDPEVVSWWDGVAARFRGIDDLRRTEIGRHGERLSVEFEAARTGVQPKWVALEQSDAGYDILSRVSRTDPETLVIETKASEKPWATAQFFVSRNEWETLISHVNAAVHLWSLATDPPDRCILDTDQLTLHVPKDHESGRWQNFRCPFSVFDAETSSE